MLAEQVKKGGMERKKVQVLNKDIHEFDDLEKKERLKEMFQNFFGINGKSYKKLWEEQNKELDQMKLNLRRKDKQIMRLKVKLKKQEDDLKGD